MNVRGAFWQVLINYCSNAIKFSGGGDVEVQCRPLQAADLEQVDLLYGHHPSSTARGVRSGGLDGSGTVSHDDVALMEEGLATGLAGEEGQDTRAQWVLLTVRDQGAGIALADLQKLFQLFSKLTDPDGVNKKGTGLGVRMLCFCVHVV